jgi:H+/Cl- antiporter ClcA
MLPKGGPKIPIMESLKKMPFEVYPLAVFTGFGCALAGVVFMRYHFRQREERRIGTHSFEKRLGELEQTKEEPYNAYRVNGRIPKNIQ